MNAQEKLMPLNRTQWDLSEPASPPGEVLYIGDRPEIDAIGASKTETSCAILGPKEKLANFGHLDFISVESYAELRSIFKSVNG